MGVEIPFVLVVIIFWLSALYMIKDELDSRSR